MKSELMFKDYNLNQIFNSEEQPEGFWKTETLVADYLKNDEIPGDWYTKVLLINPEPADEINKINDELREKLTNYYKSVKDIVFWGKNPLEGDAFVIKDKELITKASEDITSILDKYGFKLTTGSEFKATPLAIINSGQILIKDNETEVGRLGLFEDILSFHYTL
ncbi:MAG: hypothetical protein WC307_05865 [Candidatus Nanoarchaeia archaeon]|jgi:hypothetical protein